MISARFAAVLDSIRHQWQRAERFVMGQAQSTGGAANTTALSHLLRPRLDATPVPLRRWLEPLVAAAALGTMLTLSLFGLVSLFGFALAATLIVLILQQVFGIDLEVALPMGI